MKVFFYGLFMDKGLLVAKGIEASEHTIGFVDGYDLRIGERATLARRPDSRVYGAMMDIAAAEVEKLYTDESVEDYRPKPVVVELMDGARVEATCYMLPDDAETGVNSEYARALLEVATRLGLPKSYLDRIERLQS